jgi:hypothetical protein
MDAGQINRALVQPIALNLHEITAWSRRQMDLRTQDHGQASVQSEQESLPHTPEAILNIFGMKDLGKTFLMRQLYAELQHEYEVILIEFAGSTQPSTTARSYVWAEFLSLLQGAGYLSYAPNLNENVELGQDSPLSASVSAQVTFGHGPKTLVLLLDGLDRLPYWKWLQEEVLKPLIVQQRTLVICTSRSKLAWDFWEIGEQCKTLELKPFSPGEVRAYLDQFGLELFTASFIALTEGYPLALQYAVEIFGCFEQRFVDAAPVNFEQYDLSPEARLVVTYAGLVRRFDLSVVKALLQQTVISSEPVEPTTIPLLKVLTELSGLGLVEGSSSTPLRFTAGLRRAVEHKLCHEQIDVMRRICEALASIYREKICEQPSNDYLWWAANEWFYVTTFLVEHGWRRLEQCEHESEELLAHIPPTFGRRLVVAFYRDRELIDRLRLVGWISPLEHMMRKLFERSQDDISLLNPQELEEYRRKVLTRLIVDLPLDMQDDVFDWVLEKIGEGKGLLHPSTLREGLNSIVEAQQYQHSFIMRIITYFADCGYLDYDPKQYQYQANLLLKKIAPRPR